MVIKIGMIIGIRRADVPSEKMVRYRRTGRPVAAWRYMPKILHCGRTVAGVVRYGYHIDERTEANYKIVKIYAESEDEFNVTVDEVEIGYQEERLTPLERLRAWLAPCKYYDIPF